MWFKRRPHYLVVTASLSAAIVLAACGDTASSDESGTPVSSVEESHSSSPAEAATGSERMAESETTEQPTAPAPAEATSTIEEVWLQIGCNEGDPAWGAPSDASTEYSPVTRIGYCNAHDDSSRSLAFFYETPSPEITLEWLESGELDYGADDVLYVEGAVAILASDAATIAEFDELFERSHLTP